MPHRDDRLRGSLRDAAADRPAPARTLQSASLGEAELPPISCAKRRLARGRNCPELARQQEDSNAAMGLGKF